MRKNSSGIRQGGQDDEGADESAKCSGITDVDAAEDDRNQAADEHRVERVLEAVVDPTQVATERSSAVARQCPEHTAGGEVTADDGDEEREHGDDDQSERAAAGAGDLEVDFGQREEVGGFENGVQVGDTVEDDNQVEEGCEEAHHVLSQHAQRNVLPRFGHLLGQMGDDVGRADGEGTVQHSQTEDEAVATVSSLVEPVAPDEVVCGVRLSVDMGHHGTDNDGDEEATDNEESA